MKYVVMSANQLMIVDGQQVIVNQQPQIAYHKNPTAEIITIPQHQTPTYYYMDNTGSIPTQVESVEVQPIVLNHRLGSQISLVPRSLKTPMVAQQFNLMQQVQRQLCPTKIVRPQISLINNQLQHTIQNSNQEQQSQHLATVGFQQKRVDNINDQHSVTIERTNQTFKQQSSQFQKTDSNPGAEMNSKVNSIQNKEPEQETVTMSDGRVMGVQAYKELLMKQQQQRLNVMPDVSVKKPRGLNINRPRQKLPNTGIMNKNNAKFSLRQDNSNLERSEAPPVNSQCFPDNSQLQYRQTPQMDSSNRSLTQTTQYQQNMNSQQQQQMVQNSSPQPLSSPQPVSQHKMASNSSPQSLPSPQSLTSLQPPQQKPNGHNYIIQPPGHDSNKTNHHFSLPSCVPSSTLQKIIEKTPVSEDYQDTIRMLILLSNGEQRLITFSLPNQACTIQEILDQVGVPFTPETPIEVSEANTNGINYVVTVGYLLSQQNEKQQETNFQIVSEITNPCTGAVREPTPEPAKEPEQPKFIEGKMAVCGYCGYLSDDFNKCLRCKTKFPENVKTVTATAKKTDNIKQKKKKEVTNSINANTNGTKETNVAKKKPASRGKTTEHEPIILELSSDDEDDQDTPVGPVNENILHKLGSSITLSPIIKKEPSISDIQKSTLNNNQYDIPLDNSKSILLQCRTVRIGSYRTFAKENVIINSSCMIMKVAHTSNKSVTTLRIERSDIVKVLVCFQKQLPVLFYYLKPYMGKTIRDLLGMSDNDVNYYDPLSDNEPHRRLTILPENIPEDVRAALIEIYRPTMNEGLLDELTLKEANDILIKTCPKELTMANLQPTAGSILEVKQLFTYPPEGRGRISINTEDYMCLASDQLLNDVIIDFYLKYLVNGLIPEEQEKIHVFSTFFYERLTTKPLKGFRDINPSELDPHLTPAEKRHSRVKTWTKNIDLFKKDFVIVPINENCHWFLAIICYPGLDGCQTFDGNPVKIEIAPKKKIRAKTTIGSVTITPMKKEEIPCEDLESNQDEAEGDESELESDDSTDETQRVTSHANRPPIKQPCILIFDSLAGTGRSRVVATLRDYLTCEYKAKYNKEKVFTKDVIKGACPKVPQQTNFTDCGLYLLQYVEHFLMDPIKDYYIPIKGLKNWFDEFTVTRKREDISILIKKLMIDNNKDIGMLPEIMFPTKNGAIVDQFADDEEMEEENFDNEDFESPPIGSETEIDTTMSVQEEELTQPGSVYIQSSSESVCEEKSDDTVNNSEHLKTDISELTIVKPQSNRDTLSYLKAKRIIRNKHMEGPCKKAKFSH
ncbi:uncharacterized protein LOC123679317 isoform X3 [Harmonia axyridis]|uniref:uncharacterized protein LOC123679317 isoform X3 n=1 Tax=Harmonia axyridis TaxID=115357 RepID=UPI001E2756FE|nr:uncharacterized protein LOC123679317 isoform X3 [Harmonia axyridis]